MFYHEIIKDSDSLHEKVLELLSILDLCEDGIVLFSERGLIKAANSAFLQIINLDFDQLFGMPESVFNDILNERSLNTNCSDTKNSIYRFRPELTSEERITSIVDETYNNSAQKESRELVVKRTEKYTNINGCEVKVIFFRDLTKQIADISDKTKFLYKIAHELRTPITSIKGFSELLLLRELDSSTLKEVLAIICSQAGYLEELIKQILEISKIESRGNTDFCFAEHALWSIVDNALRLAPDESYGDRLLVSPPLKTYYVKADLAQLSRVVINVLNNAFKFSAPDSQVSICLEERFNHNGGEEVGIMIRDAGIGMSYEQTLRMFDLFWRADVDKTKSGIGLGMSIAKSIMDMHDGTIEVNSELGGGTEVGLWLKSVQ